jgi:AcrR family transcriptional regulator
VPPRRRLTREESKARTRQELLRAASRLFLRNGFVATSLADIAEEAGLTKGAVYSNFESKEELFLALLAGDANGRPYAAQEELAPSDTSTIQGTTAAVRGRAWGERLAGLKPNRRNVALFLEMNAFALRNERTRAGTAEHNRAFFVEVGERLAALFETPDADPLLLGMLSQSLYVGLTMHGAFDGDADPEVYGRAFEALAAVATSSRV